MRPTAVSLLYFLVAIFALLSPVAYAAPVLSEPGLAEALAKRMCDFGYCRLATTHSPNVTNTTNTTPQPDSSVSRLVQVLIDALESYEEDNGVRPAQSVNGTNINGTDINDCSSGAY